MEVVTLIAACLAAVSSMCGVFLNLRAKKSDRRLAYRKDAYLKFLRLATDMPFNRDAYCAADVAVAASYARAVGTKECAALIEQMLDYTMAYVKYQTDGGDRPPGDVSKMLEQISDQMHVEFQKELN